jgi:hypothetical protein
MVTPMSIKSKSAKYMILALLAGTTLALGSAVAMAEAGSRSSRAYSYGGDVYVQPHARNDGSYVQPHYRSAPNESRYDNYSTRGNYNPYTGKAGTRSPW